MEAGVRRGSSRWPSSTVRPIVPASTGTPTTVKSKNPKLWPPASAAASEAITLIGEPISSSSDPACPAYASGMTSREGGRPVRVASRTTSGSSAATAPVTVISEVSPAASSMARTIGCRSPVPARPVSRRPAQAVSPVACRAALTTNSAATNATTGSPKPANTCPASSTPVA